MHQAVGTYFVCDTWLLLELPFDTLMPTQIFSISICPPSETQLFAFAAAVFHLPDSISCTNLSRLF